MCYPPTVYIMFSLKQLKFYGDWGTGGLGAGGRGPGMKARDWGPDNPNTQLLITNYNNKILVESTFNESMIANLLLIN